MLRRYWQPDPPQRRLLSFPSTFGVAGTLLGAALTAMIITGGSAILGSYIEYLTSSMRTLRGRPDLWGNWAGVTETHVFRIADGKVVEC